MYEIFTEMVPALVEKAKSSVDVGLNVSGPIPSVKEPPAGITVLDATRRAEPLAAPTAT